MYRDTCGSRSCYTKTNGDPLTNIETSGVTQANTSSQEICTLRKYMHVALAAS